MIEDEGEIEYLDEDEDIVQQYVQKAPSLQEPVIQTVQSSSSQDIEDQIEPLLIERKVQHKRRAKTEDDSDYDPSEDLRALMEERKRKRLNAQKAPKKVHTYVKTKPERSSTSGQNIQNLTQKYENKLKSLPNLTVRKKSVSAKPEVGTTLRRVVKKRETLEDRRQLGIRIPDYEDPLCLPVYAVKKDDNDGRKLKLWNSLCLEHYKKAGTMFKPQRGDAVKSSRTVVLRNSKNRFTGKIDTCIYGKTTVENGWGEKKSETFQGTLPKYREKTAFVHNYPLLLAPQKHFKHTYEAVLTKETQKEGDVLVVYKPREAVSAVYKFIDNNNQDQDPSDPDHRQEKRVLKELTCCKVCATCYQASWRGQTRQSKQDKLPCAICSRTFVSVYNLLSHLNTNHNAKDVARHKITLSKTLATVVDYHYRCRICQEKFNSIKLLRKHVTKHQGVELFKCEVGNHMAS